jgi:hypothetical protein
MPALIFIGVFLALICWIVWAAIAANRRIRENLRNLATQLGMEFVPAPGRLDQPRLTGKLRGRKADIFSYVKGSGKSSTAYVTMTVQVAMPDKLSCTLNKRSFGNRMTERIATKIAERFFTEIAESHGVQEITIGDAEFDQAWMIWTNQPEFVRAALLPELRAKLVAAQRTGATGTFEIDGGLIKYKEIGYFSETEKCERFVKLVDVVGDLTEVIAVATEAQGKAEN